MLGIGSGLPFHRRPLGEAAPASPITGNIDGSRTSGVAPLSVFFDATASTATGVTKPFHYLHYAWDFDDPSSLYPSTTGPVAAHVFETPGAYDVELTITDPATGDTWTDTFTVSVGDPDTVFSGTDTICVSTSGVFTGAPSGCVQVTSSDARDALNTYAGDGKRVLFRRGETFAFDSSLILSITGPAHVGAFGTGASPDARGIYSNDPIFDCTEDVDQLHLRYEGDDIRFEHVNFVYNSTINTSALDASDRATNILVHKCSFDGLFRSAVGLSHDLINFLDVEPHDAFTLSQCRISDMNEYGIYIGGHRLAMIGNLCENNVSSHLFRVTFAWKCVFDQNELAFPGSDRHCIKLHAHQDRTRYNDYSEQIVIRNNVFRSTGAAWPVTVGPQDASTGSDEWVREVVIDGNTTHWGASNQMAYAIWSSQTTMRNNVVVADSLSPTVSVCFAWVTQRGAACPMPVGTEVYNNTLWCNCSGSGRESPFLFTEGYSGDPIPVYNNIHSVSGGGAVWMFYPGRAADVDLDTNIVDTDGTLALFVDAPTDLHPDTGSTALGTASPTYAYDDATGAVRVEDDIGAYERV